MSSKHIYAYGITEAESIDEGSFDFEVTGVGGETTRPYAVTHGPLSAIVTDIDDLEPSQTEENVQAHDEVLRAVMESDEERTIIPMRFGMVFKTKRALKNVLRSGRRAFTKALRQVDGMQEIGVKVLAPEEGDVDVDVEIEIAAPLAERSDTVAENDLFSDRLLLNRSYLLPRENREAFDDDIDRIRDAHPDLRIQYTGPWAPYSFVDIEIGAEH